MSPTETKEAFLDRIEEPEIFDYDSDDSDLEDCIDYKPTAETHNYLSMKKDKLCSVLARRKEKKKLTYNTLCKLY